MLWLWAGLSEGMYEEHNGAVWSVAVITATTRRALNLKARRMAAATAHAGVRHYFGNAYPTT